MMEKQSAGVKDLTQHHNHAHQSSIQEELWLPINNLCFLFRNFDSTVDNVRCFARPTINQPDDHSPIDQIFNRLGHKINCGQTKMIEITKKKYTICEATALATDNYRTAGVWCMCSTQHCNWNWQSVWLLFANSRLHRNNGTCANFIAQTSSVPLIRCLNLW